MILSDKIEIIGNSRNIKYYKSKGYDISRGEKILVHIKDLSEGSTFKLNFSCDNCGVEKEMQWRNYFISTKKLSEKYLCVNCCGIKRMKTNNILYGGNSPACSSQILDKIQKTNLEKYGNVCSLHDRGDIEEKTKKTNLEKYGTEYASKSQEVKLKIKETVRDRYGVDHVLEDAKIMTKLKTTVMKKYGVDNVSKSPDVIEKIRISNTENWGVDWYTQSEDMKDKSKKTCFNRYGNEFWSKSNSFLEEHNNIMELKFKTDGYILLDYTPPNEINRGRYILKSIICGHEFEISGDTYYHRKKDDAKICTICNPYGSSKISDGHQSIIEFISDIGIHNIKINDRNVIKPFELDIYLPDYKFAIEFNGLYWHSEKFKNKNYHFNKYKVCYENDIDILQIWEDDWRDKKEIIKSIIKYKLKKSHIKIYARKCEIQIINDNNSVRNFLNENHIQGWSKSNIKLGLFYENEIVSLMTFGWRKINSKKEFELIRFCNKKNTSVVGGASRLFNHFIKNFDFDKIVSYSDNSYSKGNLYKILHFENMGFTKINYYWCYGLKRYHRFIFNKKILIKNGFDENSTEVEIMHNRNYYRIFGSGHTKWVYNKI